MPLIVVHLRWNDPGADRYQEIVRAVPLDGDLPAGCLSRQLRRQGGAMTATETWDSEVSGGRMDDLVTTMRGVGVEEPPQTAMFSVPVMYEVAYRRPARAAAREAEAVEAVIPEQRGAPAHEQLPAGADVPVPVRE